MCLERCGGLRALAALVEAQCVVPSTCASSSRWHGTCSQMSTNRHKCTHIIKNKIKPQKRKGNREKKMPRESHLPG